MAAASVLTPIVDTTLTIGTILLLAALGELITERAGILNLGIEGIMSVGGLVGFATTVVTGNPYIGFLAGIVSGALFASIHGFMTITLKSDQVISGLMVTLLGTGLTAYFTAGWSDKTISGFSEVTVPVIGQYLTGIPVIGTAVFRSPPTDFLALALVPAVWYFLSSTNLGLEITAVGEDPASADSMGLRVFRLQYIAVALGGALAGAAGAHLTLAYAQLWSSGIIAGRGWIAIALVIFAQWRSERVFLGAYLFGLISTLEVRVPGMDLESSLATGTVIDGLVEFLLTPSIMQTYPYVLTILVLVLISRGATKQQLGAPSALMKSYIRESE